MAKVVGGASELPNRKPLALRRKEAAASMSISVSTLDRMTRQGKVRCVKSASVKLYPMLELERLLEEGMRGADGCGERNKGR